MDTLKNQQLHHPTRRLALKSSFACVQVFPKRPNEFVKTVALQTLYGIVLACSWPALLCAQSENKDLNANDANSFNQLPNWPLPTMGGKQFWTDFSWREGWRVQQNAVTGHWRLLDANNVRRAWGKRPACYTAMKQLAPPAKEHSHIVVLLHGLGRSHDSMENLAKTVQQRLGLTTACFEYASTRASIADHAAALRSYVDSLPDDCQISFIGHSMGNIVVRHAIADWQRDRQQKTLDRVKHAVMLGPPNQGASIARLLGKTGLFQVIAGPGGMELGPKWKDLADHLATPHCPFGIVAGHLPDHLPKNPLVGADGDFVVSVDETRLKGAADFLEVPNLHSFLMDLPDVQDAVCHFLVHAKFASPAKR